jgi:FtsH-binding integral membrane protein
MLLRSATPLPPVFLSSLLSADPRQAWPSAVAASLLVYGAVYVVFFRLRRELFPLPKNQAWIFTLVSALTLSAVLAYYAPAFLSKGKLSRRPD